MHYSREVNYESTSTDSWLERCNIAIKEGLILRGRERPYFFQCFIDMESTRILKASMLPRISLL